MQSDAPPDAPRPAWQRELLAAVRAVRFGSVEVVIHDGRVTHVERREKLRFDADGHLPDRRWRHDRNDGRTDRTTGGPARARARESEE
jgi:hypothetical protein